MVEGAQQAVARGGQAQTRRRMNPDGPCRPGANARAFSGFHSTLAKHR
ncbi:hypothetical protein [Lysobacter gummosus]